LQALKRLGRRCSRQDKTGAKPDRLAKLGYETQPGGIAEKKRSCTPRPAAAEKKTCFTGKC
jgi:hypothetical protein